MFDYHLHSEVSFDSTCSPERIVSAAEMLGLKEICFTDHYDFNSDPKKAHDLFTVEQYRSAYDKLSSDRVLIRRGVELGLTTWNQNEAKQLFAQYAFDFVIGSIHNVDGYDPYVKEFWEGKTMREAFESYLLQELACVKVHDDFDVLGHINYVCKSPNNPTGEMLCYADHRDLCDEIMKVLVQKGKGMEINTSGKDRVGAFLPSVDFIKRFRELGGEIITVGSDAHDEVRVGQYAKEALEIAKEVFGYVCTFEKRKPIFHKL